MPFEVLCMFGNGFHCSVLVALWSHVSSRLNSGLLHRDCYLKSAFLYVLTEVVGPEEGPSLRGVLRMEVFTGTGVPSWDPRQEPWERM